MLHACVQRFDVTEIFKVFGTKPGLRRFLLKMNYFLTF